MANARDSDRIYNRAIAVSVVTAAIMIGSILAFGVGVYYSAQAVLYPPVPPASFLRDFLPPAIFDFLKYLGT